MEQQQRYGGGKWNSGGGQGQAQEHFQSQSQSQSQAPHASLASHFHLLPLVEKLANGIEAGSRDQHFDTLLEELTNQFTRCQQLLNSISGTISSKSMTVEGQKRLLEETMQQLNQRRDLMNKYRLGVEEVTKSSNI
ncbi:Mediator of RNA polymerase II transcription subunit 9 [Rhynchospora pubera]|uniref:Mediator of RNA polymerase II transcription subunit 9 n=1 Tax=Rhynchospora pubera TaxID=906938 RepID=A0AAV8AJY0_9POAL|nr:Mediator of RNA polymerase II transcription subunit 9 [Rhynchospora pubera]